MAIRIAQASHSETGGKYGTAPNQLRTGVTASKPEGNLDGELNVRTYPNNFTVIYRPLETSLAEKIATFMYKAVANGSHIGYSWRGNTGVFDALKNLNSTDPSKIKTLVNTDCAALIGAAVYYSGVQDSGLRTMTTSNMDTILLRTGKFSKLVSEELCKEAKGIRRGDICWRTGHCAVSLDSDYSYPRVSLTETGLRFANDRGTIIGDYRANASTMLEANQLTTCHLYDNRYFKYSTSGTETYQLHSDNTYLVSAVQRNSTEKKNDSLWLVSIHNKNSHIIPIITGKATATVNGTTITITRPCTYCRITITRLT